MSVTYRLGQAGVLGTLVLALGGCAAIDRITSASSPESPATATLGSGTSPFMRAGLQPFSLANCMKFEAVPQECERAVTWGQ